MSSHDDGNTPRVPELPDSVNPEPADSEASASPSNAFTSSFLGRLQDRDEPPAASEADWAGPWRMERMPEEGDFGLFRMGESAEWLAVFDDDLVARASWAEGLMRSPQALALFLEACGKVILERAGAILEERVRSAAR